MTNLRKFLIRIAIAVLLLLTPFILSASTGTETTDFQPDYIGAIINFGKAGIAGFLLWFFLNLMENINEE